MVLTSSHPKANNFNGFQFRDNLKSNAQRVSKERTSARYLASSSDQSRGAMATALVLVFLVPVSQGQSKKNVRR